MERKKILALSAVIILIAIVAIALYIEIDDSIVDNETLKSPMMVGSDDTLNEGLQFGKNLDIWFMLMMVAFLMIFIRKYEWGTCLAVLLSAAASFLMYLGIQDFYFDETWNQALLIRAVICSITLVIGIGVFLGTVRMWQYLLIGVGFAIMYAFIEWFMANVEILGDVATDPGGSILVHMCAAYFGLGVALAIREKRAFDEPMYTTTHSVTFVWLGSMLLWMLWPSFVTSLLGADYVTWGTVTCYMAGAGSLVSAYAVCMLCQGKVNPLTYTYAMLCGPVAIGAPLLSVGPWGALLIGIIAGAVSAACFIYLQPWLCKKLGIVDIMGVNNLHGVGGWMGAIFVCIATGTVQSIIVAVIVFAITMIVGFAIGLIVKYTRGDIDGFATDDVDFIKNEEPKATA